MQVPAELVYPAEGCLPTGVPVRVEGATDLRQIKPLRTPNLDHCYTGLTENRIRLIYPRSGVEVRFEFDENFSHTVVYAPNREDGSPESFVAVEPVTHATNGFNLHEAGQEGSGVQVLEPGERWTTSWSISAGECPSAASRLRNRAHFVAEPISPA